MNTNIRHFDDPRQNHLLGALPPADWERWHPYLDAVELFSGQVLCDAGSTPMLVVFPTTAIVSLMVMTQDGGSAEIGVVGNDGVVGISSCMGGSVASIKTVVQSAGQGYRLRAPMMQTEMQRPGPALNLLLRYIQALINQVAQTALCNRFHSIDQQLCRRLLLGLDRLQSDELLMTQEAVANLLGVRREGVTCAAHKLQQAGLIRYNRGRIAVLDRPGLERRTCECYAVARKEYERLLPMQSPRDMEMLDVGSLSKKSLTIPMTMPMPELPLASQVAAWRNPSKFKDRQVAGAM